MNKKVDNSSKNEGVGGEITVFLTLILLLLLSFLGAAIESARYSNLESFCERDLRLGVQSLFTEYLRPLWDDYHLFMLEGGNNVNRRFEDVIESYDGKISGGFYRESHRNTEVVQTSGFLDEGGKYYLEEITEYMKYHIPLSLLEKGKESIESVEKVQKTADVLEQKMECEETLGEMDDSMLKVIEYIEGIIIYDGEIEVRDCFVKKIVPNEITPYSLGVMNNEVWNALQKSYICVDDVDISMCTRILDCINKALREITKMEKNQGSIQNKIEEYNRIYESNKDEILDGVDAGVNGDRSLWRALHNDVIAMKSDLLWNAGVLERYILAKQQKVKDAQLILNEYRVGKLRFDYKNLQINGRKSPYKSLKRTLSKSLLSLVVKNPNDITSQALPKPLLIAGKQEGSLLEIAYYQKHFKNYSDMSEEINYDLEYIVSGEETGKKALEEVVNKLFLQRGLFNYMYILTDKERTEQAYLAAVGMVGFSGMEPLIQVTKAGILLCWAMAESLIDIAVLLRGEPVPLWKTKENFHLEFQELFSFGRDLIQNEAEKEVYLQKKEGFYYKDYLGMLLFFLKPEDRINRSLALIEHNIIIKYNKNFSLLDGIYGISVDAEYEFTKSKRIKVNVAYSY